MNCQPLTVKAYFKIKQRKKSGSLTFEFERKDRMKIYQLLSFGNDLTLPETQFDKLSDCLEMLTF